MIPSLTYVPTISHPELGELAFLVTIGVDPPAYGTLAIYRGQEADLSDGAIATGGFVLSDAYEVAGIGVSIPPGGTWYFRASWDGDFGPIIWVDLDTGETGSPGEEPGDPGEEEETPSPYGEDQTPYGGYGYGYEDGATGQRICRLPLLGVS